MQHAEHVTRKLAEWYHQNRRHLPWRERPEPYWVWVSEIMLQQTQVATVIPYFERFIAQFPSIEALAEAPESDVLAAWSGLGYYRRARLLHRGVQAVVADHEGVIPQTAQALQKLPGIGPYTAAAIASIAFGEAVALVDGNVNRVLARLSADPTPIDTAAGKHAMWSLADTLLDRHDPSSHNQAMMELGALVCSPKSPQCGDCPIRAHCKGLEAGDIERYPQKKQRVKIKSVRAGCAVIQRPDGSVLLARRPDDGLLGGMWEFPSADYPTRKTAEKSLTEAWKERLGVQLQIKDHRGAIKHVFTHRRLTLDVFTGAIEGSPHVHDFYTDARWVRPDTWNSLPISKLAKKVQAMMDTHHG